MFVLRLSVNEVSFRHRSCIAGHGPGIRVVTRYMQMYVVLFNNAYLVKIDIFNFLLMIIVEEYRYIS